ncbi:NAD-dependent epimerase/dehydratase family protein [Paraherbaspirillum soli]|uniref:NAD-dependent epimerase/dehydratase family protein n=1 Tax=Paraherbaspirillum soli TaxID=631222 RepID=A0ABW0MCJ8_9BURK
MMASGMNVFMTGANGFVGLNIVAALVAAGHRVTAFVRPGSNVFYLAPFGVDIVRGELSDLGAVKQAMRGAQGVIHTAGNTSCNKRDWPLLQEVNVDGTRNVVEAAIANQVSRIVYTSTTSTIGALEGEHHLANEGMPLKGFRARSPYGISKQMAERAVLDAQKRGVSCVILNPAEVLGAFDYSLQWGRMVLAVHHNQVPFMPPGGGSFCSAAEVGRAHVNALTQGRSGERYILGGDNVRYEHFMKAIAKALGQVFDTPDVNYGWLYFKSVLQEKLPSLMPGKSIVEPYRMRVFGGTYYFDSAKAERELSYRPVPLEQMLHDCVQWYQHHGFITRGD